MPFFCGRCSHDVATQVGVTRAPLGPIIVAKCALSSSGFFVLRRDPRLRGRTELRGFLIMLHAPNHLEQLDGPSALLGVGISRRDPAIGLRCSAFVTRSLKYVCFFFLGPSFGGGRPLVINYGRKPQQLIKPLTNSSCLCCC